MRSTGAGMGCPDWPKCFGTWVPPTEVSQLPANYKEIYGAKLKGEVIFNPVKTWIEYVNRLLGAFTGIMIFLTLLASYHFYKSGNRQIFYLSFAAFILVGFQGWLGAKVVSFELKPVIVTLHMLFAIIIVFILLYLYTWSAYAKRKSGLSENLRVGLSRIGLIVMILSLIQILLGTQVREIMDEVIVRLGYQARSEWMEELSATFYVHRSFSIIILGANIIWARSVMKSYTKNTFAGKLVLVCLVVLLAEIATGLIMAYFGVPPFAQPLHLTFAILMIGLQFVVWLVVNEDKYLKSGNDVHLGQVAGY